MSATSAHLADGGTRPADGTAAPDHNEQPEQGTFAGFYAVVVGMQSMPPDRAIFREALHAALADAPESFNHCGYEISRRTVDHTACRFYFRTDRAGVYVPVVRPGQKRPTPLQIVLADDMDIEPRAVKAALWVLETLKLARHVRPRQRNRPARWLLNIGALDWPMVRARVKALRAERPVASGATPKETPGELFVVSGATPRDVSRGVGGDTTDVRTGLRTVGQISDPAAAGTFRAREADRRQEQQPGRTNRIEGLIGAIAARSRALARSFDEAKARRDLASGERTVDDLQRQADALDAECIARPFTDPATGRRIQRNPEAIAASVEHQRRLAADAGRPFDEAAAQLEAERADDLHLADCLALGDRRQERAGEGGA